MKSTLMLCVLGLTAGLPAMSRAETAPITERSGHLLEPPEATLTTPAELAGQPATGGTGDGKEHRFGRAGSWWWSVGPAVASNFDNATDWNVHGNVTTFLADELEFGVEAAGWYFNQVGKNTGGVSGSMIFRWHFAHDDDFRWSVFGDVGIGILGAFDEVPDGGTGFNFLPRAGLGFTHALTDDETGPRITLGARWHHISNARIEGDERNPGRDALMGYFEIQFPF